MDNPFDEMRAAVRQARELNNAVDRQASTLAEFLDGRLRHVSSHYLKRLKKQLQDFNAHTDKWKDSTMPHEFDLEDDDHRFADDVDASSVSCKRCGAGGLHWRAVTSATGMSETRRLVDDQMRKHVCQANANDFS